MEKKEYVVGVLFYGAQNGLSFYMYFLFSILVFLLYPHLYLFFSFSFVTIVANTSSELKV